METKAFRIDWYPHQAFVHLSELSAEQIGVFIQIINLIYIHNGPIRNDPKHIGKSCGMGGKKCAGIINKLIHKEFVSLTSSGNISQKRCEIELENIQKRREIASKNGKKGAGIRWDNEENQDVSDGDAIFSAMASTIPESSTSINTDTNDKDGSARQDMEEASFAPFNIEYYLDDNARQRAREAAPGWDIYHLIEKYNQWINSGSQSIPNTPAAAFIGWCAKYTKGKPPP